MNCSLALFASSALLSLVMSAMKNKILLILYKSPYGKMFCTCPKKLFLTWGDSISLPQFTFTLVSGNESIPLLHYHCSCVLILGPPPSYVVQYSNMLYYKPWKGGWGL